MVNLSSSWKIWNLWLNCVTRNFDWLKSWQKCQNWERMINLNTVQLLRPRSANPAVKKAHVNMLYVIVSLTGKLWRQFWDLKYVYEFFLSIWSIILKLMDVEVKSQIFSIWNTFSLFCSMICTYQWVKLFVEIRGRLETIKYGWKNMVQKGWVGKINKTTTRFIELLVFFIISPA